GDRVPPPDRRCPDRPRARSVAAVPFRERRPTGQRRRSGPSPIHM
ncbi:MAG: hypothetical protein AVDCRST_MAG73-2961, partial [uncultured Thermomicrobiales bacterium]